MNLAFVIANYGIEKFEPLEIYCRANAENLYRRGIDVVIYTSTNGREKGEYILNGVLIKRFELEKGKTFSPHLLKKLIEEEKNYDAILFFGLHHYENIKGAERLKGKEILVPYLYEKVEEKDYLSRIFSKFDGLVFITEREKENFKLGFKKSEVIEPCIDIKIKIAPDQFRKRNFIFSDYILCYGKDEDLKEIFENFKILKRKFPFLTLVVLGEYSRKFPFDPDIKYIEIGEEKERLECVKGSLFTLFPSEEDNPDYFFFESLSLGVPAVINERKETLVDYCSKSNGGLWYSGKEEFLEIASLLVKDRLLRNGMGIKAQKYIKENHSPQKIFLKWKEFLSSFI